MLLSCRQAGVLLLHALRLIIEHTDRLSLLVFKCMLNNTPYQVHFYLDSIGAETFYIGFVIGSLSLGAMISAPIYAAITDHFKKAIYIIRVGMIFSIGGSCLYFLVPQKNIIVLARFIGGVGWGLEGALMGQIGRTFNQENKTSKFAAVLMMRQFGVLVGPIMIYALPHLAFTKKIGSWELIVSEYSAAGLLLGK